MNLFMKVSETSNLALHAMAFLAGRPGRPVRAEEIARAYGASRDHLFKILGKLARAGLVESVRGRSGGYRLGKEPSRITLSEIFRVAGSPFDRVDCLYGKPLCGGRKCVMGGALKGVNEILGDYFDNTDLSSFSAEGVVGAKAGKGDERKVCRRRKNGKGKNLGA